jgi:hypothetical protein
VIHHGSLVPNIKSFDACQDPLPSYIGVQSLVQDTFALALTSLPLQRNLLNFCSKREMVLIGRIKIWAQKILQTKQH